jgi:hypothetical protein
VSPDFSERSLQVCRDFLQTAVIIDDRFQFQSQTPPVTLSTTPGRKNKIPIIRAEKKADGNGGALNANRLIKSFAAHGIICGALNFKEYKQDSIAFLKIAKRADIVIIDWEMEEEKTGEHALSLISNLLQDDLLSPQRFRLISIYTGAEDLSSISESIQNHLKENHSVQLCVKDQGLHLTYHSITVTIFAKDAHGIPEHFKGSVVDEQELPDRLISCFSQTIHGILPNTALAALTALRNNSHKLLGQFSSRLDAAYLSHKIMSTPPEDAESQLVQLIVSHISGILEEHNVAEQANYPATESWLKKQCESGTQLRNRIHIKKDNGHAKDQLLKLVKFGLTKASLNKGNKSFYKQISMLKNETTKSVLSGLTAIFTSKIEDAESLDRDLSYMLSCKTFYESSIPKLESGTILKHVKEGGEDSYLICIQPACDCVRIPKKGRKFLFLPLVPSNEKFDICIPKEKLDALNLRVDDKAYSITTLHFAPPKASEPIVAVRNGTDWVFVTSDPAVSYGWIATLKPEFVLRLAHNYGKNVSRVGITESEWQRRWAK